MPLRSGKSRDTISRNIKTLMHEWEEEGHIGTSHPANRQKAVKQAVAIALSKAGVPRRRSTGTRRKSAGKG